MCGGSVGSVVSKVSNAAKSVTSGAINVASGGLIKKSTANTIVDKGASIAVDTAAGFAAGGAVGASAGFADGIYQNTKTGKAKTINLRTTGQAAVVGGVTNIAAGAALSGYHALAGGITGTSFVPGVGQVASYTPGATFSLSNGLSSAVSWAAKGGLSNTLINLGKSALKGASNYGASSSTTDIPNEWGTPDLSSATNKIKTGADKALTGYNRLRQALPNNIQSQLPSAADVSNKVRSAVGRATGSPSDSTVNVSTPASGGIDSNLLLLAGAGILAFMFIKKK